MARICANKVTPPKWSPQLFKIKENLLCPENESVLTFCWILGPCWSQLITADQMWTWLSRGALRHNRRHDPCSDHSNQQLFEVHSHSTVHDCSVTFCGKYIAHPFPIFPWRLPVPENCPCGFVDLLRFTLGPVGSIRHMGLKLDMLDILMSFKFLQPLTISHRFNGPHGPVQTIQKIICEVDLPSNVIRHAFQHPQLCIALWVVPPERGGRKVQHGALKQQWCSDMQWCTSHCLFRSETPGVS